MAEGAAATAFRFAFRELRGGLRGFYVFLGCLAIGVATIAGVASVTRTMNAAIEREGRAILGGDLAVSLVQRPAGPDERAFLEAAGRVSEVATLRAMARLPDGADQTLIELKAVDDAYPLAGTLVLGDGGPAAGRLAAAGDGFGALADDTLLVRLGLAVGDRIRVGDATLTLTGTIDTEPDRLSDGAEWGPRVMISHAALEATGLIQPGSLIRWLYRVALPGDPSDATVEALADAAATRFADAGWRVRTRDNASPGLARNIDRLAQFLTLVGLSALIVGGVGVANAVSAYLDAKRDVIATFKCLGAPAGLVSGIYLVQIMALALLGIVVGLAAGALMPFAAAYALAGVLPISAAPAVYPLELALAALYGILTALAFALWPLGRARAVPAAALFRDRVAPQAVRPGRAYVVASAFAVLALIGLAIGLAHDRRIALTFVGAAAGAFVLLRLVGLAIMVLARRAPALGSTELRLALANIHRPGALTTSVVLSLGLGLSLLATLVLIDGNLRHQLTATIPEKAPSFFFLNIQNDELDPFLALLKREAPGAAVDHVPMLRGRIVSVKGVPADEVDADPDVRWALSGDRGITYSAAMPENARLRSGAWWPADYDGPPLVSMEAEIADGIGLRLGDGFAVNVLGREIEVRLANTRVVEWERLAINFVMVFSPNTFRGAPHSHLATLTFPDGGTTEAEVALLRTVGTAFPTVTAIRVKEALDRVNDILGQITWAILAASSVTLVTAVLVLAGALAAGHRRRLYDATILKTLGATRRRVIAAFGLEYLILGAVTAVFGVIAGALAAWFVLTIIMDADFVFLPGAALGTIAASVLLTVGFGLAGTWRILGQKAAPVLRNL